MKSLPLRIAPLLVAALCRPAVAAPAVAAPAAIDPIVAQSPFRDKAALSYSSLNNVPIPWTQFHPNDFGPRTVQFDSSGLRALRPVPPPGVHPRVLFTPDDLPDIRHRLKTTRCGQEVWKNILSWTEALKGRYNDRADYAQPDVMKGSFRMHGRVPLYRLGIDNQPANARKWAALIAGDDSVDPGFAWNVLSLEAFRCLIENDAAGARDVAKATVTAMRFLQAQRAAAMRAKHDTGPLSTVVGGTGGIHLAYVYDFVYQWLTPAQRDAMHQELADGTWYHDNYGTFNNATQSRSNWATFSYWLIQELAIEGEPGFNDLKFRGLYRGWRDLLTYGWYPTGAVFEGEAKDQLGMDGVIAFSMRTGRYGLQELAAHPYLRANATNFLPHSIMPWRGEFVQYDLLGGPHNRPNPLDAIGLKFMFPADRRVDWVYRNAIGDNYEHVPDRPDGYYNGILTAAIFASDYDPTNDDPARLNLSPTFFDGERALLMTRSDWGKDALFLSLHVRQASGGHPYADRNSILIAGQGRAWSIVFDHNAFDNNQNSVVVVDHKPQSVETPGRMVAFQDGPLATFVVGDAKYAWDWNWQRLGRPQGYTAAQAGEVKLPAGAQPVLNSINDFAYTRRPDAYLNAPLFLKPHWLQPDGYIEPVVRTVNYPVRRAFRTAGLVRGPHPYALVLDDIQKDDEVHHYDWNLALEPDVQIASMDAGARPGIFDIVLCGSTLPPKAPKTAPPQLQEKPGDPMLLIRVLAMDGRADTKPAFITEDAKTHHRVLVIPADAVAPDYKVLLYPFRQGEARPDTTWDAQHRVVNLTIGQQHDHIAFTPAASGKTDVGITRDNGGRKTQVITVNHEITPLKEPAP